MIEFITVVFDYLQEMNTTEMMRIVLIIGGFLALQFKSSQGITPGGIVVPSILAMALISSPVWAAIVILLSFVVYYVYSLLHARLPEHFHRGRTPLFILGFLTLVLSFTSLALLQRWDIMQSNILYGIFIPAIVGYLAYRQDFRQVMSGLIQTSLATLAITVVIYTAVKSLWGYDFTTIDVAQSVYPIFTFEFPLLVFLLSMAIGFIVYQGSGIRSGGFIVTPIVSAMLVYSPLNALLFFVAGIAIYKLVNSVVKRGLLVGLQRYYVVMVLSILVLWIMEYALLQAQVTFTPFLGSSIFAVIALVTYVNDSMVYSPEKVIPLIGMSLTFVSLVLLIA